MSFLVSLPVTFLVYGNSRKLQNISQVPRICWELMFLPTPPAQRPLLLPLCLAIFPPEITQRHGKMKIGVLEKKTKIHILQAQLAVDLWSFTAPFSDHLSIFQLLNTSHGKFPAWWLANFYPKRNSQPILSSKPSDTFLQAWHWHHFEGFKKDSFPKFGEHPYPRWPIVYFN